MTGVFDQDVECACFFVPGVGAKAASASSNGVWRTVSFMESELEDGVERFAAQPADAGRAAQESGGCTTTAEVCKVK